MTRFLSKTVLFLTVCMFIWTSLLFYATICPVFLKKEKELYLSYDEVAHVALSKNGKEELLSFEQQMQFLSQLNHLKTQNFTLVNDKNEIFHFEKIVIYRFNQNHLNILQANPAKQDSVICLNNL